MLAPGEFRIEQNWIDGSGSGNARFVPPPPGDMDDALGDLEKFFHNEPFIRSMMAMVAWAGF